MDLLEGGIRVPCVVRWPARVPSGKRTNRLAMGMDWTPTFIAAAGVSAHRDCPLDGIDLFGPEVERDLYWRMVYRNQKAVRSGAWKYLSLDGAEFLYDLSRDERERANMRYREPVRFNGLRAAYRVGSAHAARSRGCELPTRLSRRHDGPLFRLARAGGQWPVLHTG